MVDVVRAGDAVAEEGFVEATNTAGGVSRIMAVAIVGEDGVVQDPAAPGLEYETVAASVTAQALGATGAAGDYLSHINIRPLTTAPGAVTILDNATEVDGFTGGTVGADLKSIIIPVGAFSVSGAWKITTGANVKVTAYGVFT